MKLRLAVLAEVAVAALFAAACTSTLPSPSPAELPIATQAAPSSACDEALVQGRLARNDRSGLGLSNAGQSSPIVWPYGFSAIVEDGQAVLLNELGAPVARESDAIQFGGGLGANDFFYVCPAEIKVLGPGI